MSLKQRYTSLCPVDCKGLRVQQEHFHSQYPRAVSVQRLEHPLREKEGVEDARGRLERNSGLKILAERGMGGRGEVDGGCVLGCR